MPPLERAPFLLLGGWGRDHMRDTKREGELAESAFLHKALKIGLKVSKPFGDSERYDFIVDNGRKRWRVQVRSTRTISRPKMYSVVACFKINHGRGAVQQVPYTDEEIDFLAVQVVPEDTWYLLPVAALRGRLRLNLYSKDHRKPGPEAKYKGGMGAVAGLGSGHPRRTGHALSRWFPRDQDPGPPPKSPSTSQTVAS
jgi:PD-(D/E)XK nuclease superfamily protein